MPRSETKMFTFGLEVRKIVPQQITRTFKTTTYS